jgi:hypothetical protein
MSTIISTIVECITGRPTHSDTLEEKHAPDFLHNMAERSQTTEARAAEFVSILYSAQRNDGHLAKRLQDIVHETGWYDEFVEAIVARLVDVVRVSIKVGGEMGQAMKEALEKSLAEAREFAKEHPMFCVVIALGILVILSPWVIEVLGFQVGFGELGPVAGMSVMKCCKEIHQYVCM